MSDPVSNAEIEDVLSSIRRLVSVDSRTEPHDHLEPSARRVQTGRNENDTISESTLEVAEPLPQEEARLVLTPSFRVNPAKDEDEDDTAQAEIQDEETDHLTLGQWQVEPEPSDATEDASESADALDEAEAGHAEELQTEQSAGLLDETDHDQADGQDDDDRSTERGEDAEDQVASQDAEDNTLESPWDEGDDAELAAFAEDEDTRLDFIEVDEEISEAEDTAATSELEARIAEVEAAVAAREDQWEPDGESADAYAGGKTEPLPWEDHIEQAEVPEVPSGRQPEMFKTSREETATFVEADEAESEQESEAQTDRFNTADASAKDVDENWYSENSDAILDEDALRDLVSEIVRQELQGTLGERITRNVRKLVRREIHRAMMGQDFE